MRLIVTGGGTGGHVFPALEVARLAISQGHEVVYIGSLRGQEGRACDRLGIEFRGHPSEPLRSLKTPRGWRAAANLLRATRGAKRDIRKLHPDAVFSTGGYSGAPVMSAARSLAVPYVVHEQNSVPGRSNLMFAKRASVVATTFFAAESAFAGCRVVRTGLPVRAEIRRAAAARGRPDGMRVLVFGGSQGAAALNEAALGTAQRMAGAEVSWLHLAGKTHFETIFRSYGSLGLPNYQVKAFLEADQMGEAYSWATVAVARSGAGTLAELAAYRLASVLVPFPQAYAQHQLHNAKEFEALGAARVVEQANLHPATIEAALKGWADDGEARVAASKALAEWDAPDATERILELISAAAQPSNPDAHL